MSDAVKIFIDRLKAGQTDKWDEVLEPTFLGPNEAELCFSAPVKIKGEAYLTDSHLILHFGAETTVMMPCAICNKMIAHVLQLKNGYHAEPLEEIPSNVFNYSDTLRESLLLELPKTIECNGKCPERAIVVAFMREQKKEQAKEDIYFPFADIDLNKEN